MDMTQSDLIKSIEVDNETFDIYEITDVETGVSEGYDIFDANGDCINMGNVLYKCPTEKDIRAILNKEVKIFDNVPENIASEIRAGFSQ